MQKGFAKLALLASLVLSFSLYVSGRSVTAAGIRTQVPTATATATATPTNTPVAPTATATATPTNTPVAPTATATATPTNTPAAPTATPTPIPVTNEQLYAPSVVPPESIAIGSTYAVETAQRINFSCNGVVKGIWWYRTPSDTGNNTVTAWRGSTVVGQTSGNPGAFGWVHLDFTIPVPVTPGDQLLVGVHHPNGAYGYRLNGFNNRSVNSNSGCMVAPAATATAKTGLYQYTPVPALPDLSYLSSEYFIGPDFSTTMPPPPPPPPVSTARLYADSVTPPSSLAIGSAYAVQTAQRVNFNCNGKVNGIWWYRIPQDTGVNTVTAWRGGTVVATTAMDPGTTGWTYMPFAAPVPVTIGDELVLGVHHPNGAYGYRLNGFANRSVVAGCLVAPATSGAKPNGLYQYTPPTAALPTLSYAASEYFIGPDFSQS